MFRIKIAHRVKPFSHLKKTQCLIPCSTFAATITVGKVSLENLVGRKKVHLLLGVKGPVRQFTVEQDLEKCRVNVMMRTESGDIRYYLERDGDEVVIVMAKVPKGGLTFTFNGEEEKLKKHHRVALCKDGSLMPYKSPTRLFLGCTKGQNVEGIMWRHDMKEVLPILYALSKVVPEIEGGSERGGNYELLEKGEISHLFEAGFESLLMPRSNDTDYQGFVNSESEAGPLGLLSGLKSLILSLFIKEVDGRVEILPNLPKMAVSGRLIGVELSIGKIDLEWTKGKVRRLALYANRDASISFKFPKNITSYSLSVNKEFKNVLKRAPSPLKLRPKMAYFLSDFKK